jgi:hypothetical protein
MILTAEDFAQIRTIVQEEVREQVREEVKTAIELRLEPRFNFIEGELLALKNDIIEVYKTLGYHRLTITP